MYYTPPEPGGQGKNANNRRGRPDRGRTSGNLILRFVLHEIRFALMLLKPMQCHQSKVLEIHCAVAVYTACADSLTRRFPKIRLPRLRRAAVGAHVDNAAVGEWFISNRAHRVACVNTRTRHIVPHPSSIVRIPPSSLGLQMVIAIDPEIIIDVSRRPIRVPIARVGKTGISVNIAFARPAALDITETYHYCRTVVVPYRVLSIPHDGIERTQRQLHAAWVLYSLPIAPPACEAA